ncbi:MAG: SRPBCC family protein [Ilumatobacteraceae bacterium]
MTTLRDELIVDASPSKVWTLTIDVESWPKVTPTVTSVSRLDDGAFGVGSRARIKQPRQPAAVWTVTRYEPESLFEWSRSSFGLTVVAAHHIEPLDDGRCRNVLTLELSGPMAKVFGWLLARPSRRAIATENASFKRAAESAA